MVAQCREVWTADIAGVGQHCFGEGPGTQETMEQALLPQSRWREAGDGKASLRTPCSLRSGDVTGAWLASGGAAPGGPV